MKTKEIEINIRKMEKVKKGKHIDNIDNKLEYNEGNKEEGRKVKEEY